jgi:hypothetical protein
LGLRAKIIGEALGDLVETPVVVRPTNIAAMLARDARTPRL